MSLDARVTTRMEPERMINKPSFQPRIRHLERLKDRHGAEVYETMRVGRLVWLMALSLGCVWGSSSVDGQIYRWDTGELIAGTEHLVLGPGMNLQNGSQELQFADLANRNLAGAQFRSTNLANASLRNTDLSHAILYSSNLTGADFSAAKVDNTSLAQTTEHGFTKEQLYETNSYKEKSLYGIGLEVNHLDGWNFQDQDLTQARFYSSRLEGANFTNAIVKEANFADTVRQGFTPDQLYATKSYKVGNLRGINLNRNDLREWDFHQQMLVGADFSGADLSNADLTQANVSDSDFQFTTLDDADLSGTIVGGTNFSGSTLTQEQLYATASYQHRTLRGVRFGKHDLSGWNFQGQDLRDATMGVILWRRVQFPVGIENAELNEGDFSAADLRGARYFLPLESTKTINSILPDGRIDGLALGRGMELVIRDDEARSARQYGLEEVPVRHEIPIRIEDVFSMESTSRLVLQLKDEHWSSTISFDVPTSLELNGVLDVQITQQKNRRALVGTTFDIFDWDNVTPIGAFEVVTAADETWDLSRLYETGEVTLLSVSLDNPSDFDQDGTVDFADFLSFAAVFESDGVGRNQIYDLNLDGRIDFADFTRFADSFVSRPTTVASVAEPSSGGLLFSLFVCLLGVRCIRCNAGTLFGPLSEISTMRRSTMLR